MQPNKAPLCKIQIIHPEIVKLVKKKMPDEILTMGLSDLFKVFGDSTRIKILHALLISEMCVCDLASSVNMTQSAISHQLRILKQSKLVKYRKEGKIVYYSLEDKHVKYIMQQGKTHIGEN